MKKKTLVVMGQSRKLSEREKIALQQAKETLALKEAAVAEAAQAISREDYILDLMTDASLDMAGMPHKFYSFPRILLFPILNVILSLNRFLFRCCCRGSTG
jgi:hypothetical protein